MKYLHLIWAQMTRRKIRTILTLTAVSAAFVLFGLLASVYNVCTEFGRNVAAAHRLVTLARSSYMFGLPLGLYGRIRGRDRCVVRQFSSRDPDTDLERHCGQRGETTRGDPSDRPCDHGGGAVHADPADRQHPRAIGP